MTVLLTTHYMEEADALCDRVALMHLGTIRAEGTPDEPQARRSARRRRSRTCSAIAPGGSLDGAGPRKEVCVRSAALAGPRVVVG